MDFSMWSQRSLREIEDCDEANERPLEKVKRVIKKKWWKYVDSGQ